MAAQKDQNSYVRGIFDDMSHYVRELLTENERLRELAARLESDRRHSERELQRQVESQRSDRDELQRQLAELTTESRKYLESYLELEQQNTKLANLYVASHRLHATLDRNEVLAAVQEIVINLVGSEEVAIFEVIPGTRQLQPLSTFGLHVASFDDLPPAARTRILHSLGSGEVWVRNGCDDSAGLTAAIPLAVEGKPTGVIAVFRLLQQKSDLEPADRELFELLASHAATALYCTALHAQHGRHVQAVAS